MIVQRLFRFALGPSYADKGYGSDNDLARSIKKARQENDQQAMRIMAAEGLVMNYVGLGLPKFVQKSLPDGEDLADLNSYGVSGSSNDDDSTGEIILATFYQFLYSCTAWPFYVARARIQTFSFTRGLKYSSVLGSSINEEWGLSGLLHSAAHEAIIQSTDELADRLKLSPGWTTFCKAAAWLLSYPILKQSTVALLGLTPEVLNASSFLKMLTKKFWSDNWSTMLDTYVCNIFSRNLRVLTAGTILYYAAPKPRHEEQAKNITQFATSALGELSADFLCIFLSSVMFRRLASKSGAMESACYTSQQFCDWRLLLKACAVEWAFSCLMIIAYDKAYKWFLGDKVE